MTRLLLATAFATLTALPALASGDDMKLDDATRAQITATLTEQGYEVRKIDSEDGLYEAYVIKDGKRLELYLDAAFNVVQTKTDD